MTYTGIVFDFNGTLLWDMDLHEQVWREICQRHLDRPLTDEEFHHGFVGRTNAEIWPRLLGRELHPDESYQLSEEKEAAYRELLTALPHRMKLVDGAEQLFELCLEAGVQIAIGTAAGQSNKDFYVEAFGLHRWFRPERIVYDDGTLPGKPDPALFATAMARMDVPPSRCLVVEDGILGIQAARAAGAGKVYGIWSDAAGLAKLSSVPLDRIIHTYREMDLADFR